MRDTATGMLKQTQIQYEELETEEGTIAALERMNDDAVGMSQISQVGNMMANHQVRQMQKLRMLVMLQNKMISTEAVNHQTEKDVKRAKMQRMIQRDGEEEEEQTKGLLDKANEKMNIDG